MFLEPDSDKIRLFIAEECDARGFAPGAIASAWKRSLKTDHTGVVERAFILKDGSVRVEATALADAELHLVATGAITFDAVVATHMEPVADPALRPKVQAPARAIRDALKAHAPKAGVGVHAEFEYAVDGYIRLLKPLPAGTPSYNGKPLVQGRAMTTLRRELRPFARSLTEGMRLCMGMFHVAIPADADDAVLLELPDLKACRAIGFAVEAMALTSSSRGSRMTGGFFYKFWPGIHINTSTHSPRAAEANVLAQRWIDGNAQSLAYIEKMSFSIGERTITHKDADAAFAAAEAELKAAGL